MSWPSFLEKCFVIFFYYNIYNDLIIKKSQFVFFFKMHSRYLNIIKKKKKKNLIA
jgi:hypothetical protein